MIRVMIVIIIDQSLKIADLYLFVTILAFNQGIELNHGEIARLRGSVTFKELLYNFVVFKFIRGDAEDLEGLLSGHEAALDAKTFLSDLFAAFVAELLHLTLHAFLLQVASYFIHALRK
jgi:hypothetical protein